MSNRRLFLTLFVIHVSVTSLSSVEKLSSNPYRGIVSRNSFGLDFDKHKTVVPPPALLPTAQLLGITTILGDKRAIVKVRWPAKADQAAREQTFVLKNYQSTGEIEVMEIDERAATVCVKISGIVRTLGFESDLGASPNPLPAPPQPPG